MRETLTLAYCSTCHRATLALDAKGDCSHCHTLFARLCGHPALTFHFESGSRFVLVRCDSCHVTAYLDTSAGADVSTTQATHALTSVAYLT